MKAIWKRNKTFVRSWIIRSLSTEIAQSVLFVKKASDLWVELRQRFSQGNHMRVADLNKELHSLKQGTFTVTTFFTQLKKLGGEIKNFRPINPCVCGIQCMCKVYRE